MEVSVGTAVGGGGGGMSTVQKELQMVGTKFPVKIHKVIKTCRCRYTFFHTRSRRDLRWPLQHGPNVF